MITNETVPASEDLSFRFDITNDKDLDKILEVAFLDHNKAYAYKVENGRLILSWLEPSDPADGWSKFLAPVNAVSIVSMITDWLATQDYEKEPPYDGTASKGFRVYNQQWGHVGDYKGFVAIEPHWIFYGK